MSTRRSWSDVRKEQEMARETRFLHIGRASDKMNKVIDILRVVIAQRA